jgi:hypothetical protein
MYRHSSWLAIVVVTVMTLLCRATAVGAAVILSPATVLGTDIGEAAQNAGVSKMIDQSGLDKPFVSGVTDFDTYFTTGDEPFAQATAGNNWQSETQFTLPVSGNVDFDFGAVFSIDRLAIWNISMKDIKIHTSATSIDSLTEVGIFALPNHLNFPFSYRHDLLDLGDPIDVRFMRIEIDSVHLFSPSDTFGFAIVGEVAASAVPASASVEGDYNANGTVDAADYVAWRDTLGRAGVGLAADGDGNGTVEPSDYEFWKARFGAKAGIGAGDGMAIGAVPEPTTPVLLILVAAGGLATRRPRRATRYSLTVTMRACSRSTERS